ncbi:MAG: hypothetical protein P8N49_01695 [Opitutales bacterium]|nr:hypothetical protein [Opitutales bacterium]
MMPSACLLPMSSTARSPWSRSSWGSVRAGPTAAAQAIDEGVSFQDVDYDKLRGQLLKDGQKL